MWYLRVGGVREEGLIKVLSQTETSDGDDNNAKAMINLTDNTT